jgi:hypothetical protein
MSGSRGRIKRKSCREAGFPLAIRSSSAYREGLPALALLRAFPDLEALAAAFASLRA